MVPLRLRNMYDKDRTNLPRPLIKKGNFTED